MSSEPPLLNPPLMPVRRRSTLLKLCGICLLVGALHVPLVMTWGVLRERQRYQAEAAQEIASRWGQDQSLTGPVLEVPYLYRGTIARTKLVNSQWTQVDEPATQSACAYFLPEDLHIEGTVDPEVRHRGIYDAVVYTARLKFAGRWRPDFAAAGIDADRVEWDKARIRFGVSDLHGLRSITPVRGPDGNEAGFDPVEATDGTSLPLAARWATAAAPANPAFAFEVVVQGSGGVRLAPVGKTTTATLRAPWRDPSFIGAWLPVQRHVGDGGFNAEWAVAYFSRGFPQSWTTRSVASSEVMKQINAGAFGVRFASGMNGYGMVQRAQKYGVLFFVLIFAVFFLFEITSELRIHPLQYAMVGAALCLFFLGFLALTEFWNTAVAYAVAAGACTGMVALYAWTFLHTGARTAVVGGGLAATYGYLYFVLQSQDYALIAGTVALFGALALAMFFTRRINWYAVDAGR